MKKILTFVFAIFAAVSLNAATEIEIVVSSDITEWGYGGNDLGWEIESVKDQNNQVWNFVMDHAQKATEYPFWGQILTDADTWENLAVKKGYVKSTIKSFRFIAVMDGATQRWELEAEVTNAGEDYHVHASHNLPEGGLFNGGGSEEKGGSFDVVSNDLKSSTAEGTDIFISEFTAKDIKGRTWSFVFDPTAKGSTYPFGTTMTLADLDNSESNQKYNHVALDGSYLTLTSVTLFMDINEDNGNPYLEATVVGTLDEAEYTVHVTANKPAPAKEIAATSMKESVAGTELELQFTDNEGTSVTIDFAESTIYFDQVYTYSSRKDSITAIMTELSDGSLEGMNAGSLYNCKANFLVTKGEGNEITIALSYVTAKDNKYKLTYTGAYTGSHIGTPVVEPDTVQINAPLANAIVDQYLGAEVQSIMAASEDYLNSMFVTLKVGSLLGEDDAPGVFTEADLTSDSEIVIDGDDAPITTANITIQKGLKGAYQLEAFFTSATFENKVFHFTTNAFGYQYAFEAQMIKVYEDDKSIYGKSGDVEAYFFFDGEQMPKNTTVTSLLAGSSINMEAITSAELTIACNEEGVWMVNGMVVTEAYSTYTIAMTSALPAPSKTVNVALTNGEWSAPQYSDSWMLKYYYEGEDELLEGQLIFTDYSGNFARSYSAEEVLMYGTEIFYVNESVDGATFSIVDAKDILVAVNEAGDVVTLTGSLTGIDENNNVWQFNLNVSGEYPKAPAKDGDESEEGISSEDEAVGQFYVSSIDYDAFFESTTVTAYTENKKYMAQLVINDGTADFGGIMPLAMSEGIHPVSDDANAAGICLGGELFHDELQGKTIISGSAVVKLDEEGEIETAWLLTEGFVAIEGQGDEMKIFVSAANSCAQMIDLYATMPKDPSALNNTDASLKTVKTVRGGQLIIRRGETEFNALGTMMK